MKKNFTENEKSVLKNDTTRHDGNCANFMSVLREKWGSVKHYDASKAIKKELFDEKMRISHDCE